jgi:uncharacterized protein DUF4846
MTACSGVYDPLEIRNPSTEFQTENVKGISLPEGFHYVKTGDSLYAEWLLGQKFKKSKTVYLYDGRLKANQDVQFAVLDIDIGKKDLIQCADAAIKLRADYLFKQNRFSEINFTATSGDELSFERWMKGTRWKQHGSKLVPYTTLADYPDALTGYNSFMELIYSYCGTFSLPRQLREVQYLSSIQPGDIFVQGGFPGHAVTVMVVAENKDGKKIFLLSQGYMPAQDIHILKNYENSELSPWYDETEMYPLNTPQWQFENGSLRRW